MQMLNDQHGPNLRPNEEEILDVIHESGGRMRPSKIAERVGRTQQANDHYLRLLIAAGWVYEPEDGLYDIAFDPREMSTEEIATAHRSYADLLERWSGTTISPEAVVAEVQSDPNPEQ